MGCDIHVFIEYHNGYGWDCAFGDLDPARQYDVFARLANVRGEHEKALPLRGLPDDASYTAKWGNDPETYDRYGQTWLTSQEWRDAIADVDSVNVGWHIITDMLDGYERRGYQTRVVIAFDS